jgi:hypothetical protein
LKKEKQNWVKGKDIFLKKEQGTLTERGRLSTVDLLTMIACFATKLNNIFNIKMS